MLIKLMKPEAYFEIPFKMIFCDSGIMCIMILKSQKSMTSCNCVQVCAGAKRAGVSDSNMVNGN